MSKISEALLKDTGFEQDNNKQNCWQCEIAGTRVILCKIGNVWRLRYRDWVTIASIMDILPKSLRSHTTKVFERHNTKYKTLWV